MGWSFTDLFKWTPIGLTINAISNPDKVVDQFNDAGEYIANDAKDLVHNPLKFVADKASGALKDMQDKMNNPTGYICDELGVDQPQFLKDFNDRTNTFHQFNEMMDYANGKDLVLTLQNIKEVVQSVTKTYGELAAGANQALQFFTDLAIANAHLVGIPQSVLQAKLPKLPLKSLREIEQQMPAPDLGDDKPTNLFDVWKNGGSKDLPDGVNTLIDAGRYAIPLSNIWANVDSKIYDFIAQTGRKKMKSQIREWQNYLAVLTEACSNAEDQVTRYTWLTQREGQIYVAFARAVNQARAGTPGVEALAIPDRASTGYSSIEDLHAHIWAAQHDADRILGEYLADIPAFSSYLQGTGLLAKGYQEYLVGHPDRKNVELGVDSYLASALAQDHIRELNVNRDKIRRMLILITLWGAAHHGDLVLDNLSEWEVSTDISRRTARALVDMAGFIHNVMVFERDDWQSKQLASHARNLFPFDSIDLVPQDFPAQQATRLMKRWYERWSQPGLTDNLIYIPPFARLRATSPTAWAKMMQAAPPTMRIELDRFEQRTALADDGTMADVFREVADALFDLGTALDVEIDKGRVDSENSEMLTIVWAKNSWYD